MEVKNGKQLCTEILQDVIKEISLMDQFKDLTNIVSYEEHKVIRHKKDLGWDILIRMELLKPLKEYEREQFNSCEKYNVELLAKVR